MKRPHAPALRQQFYQPLNEMIDSALVFCTVTRLPKLVCERIFERFVRNFYKAEQPSFSVRALIGTGRLAKTRTQSSFQSWKLT